MSAIFNNWCNELHSQNLEGILNLYDSQAVLLPTFSDILCIGIEHIKTYFVDFIKKKPKCELVNSYQVQKDGVTIFNGFYNFRVANDLIKARFSFIISDNGKILAHHSSLMPEIKRETSANIKN